MKHHSHLKKTLDGKTFDFYSFNNFYILKNFQIFHQKMVTKK